MPYQFFTPFDQDTPPVLPPIRKVYDPSIRREYVPSIRYWKNVPEVLGDVFANVVLLLLALEKLDELLEIAE